MYIKFNETEKRIEIRDGWKQQYFLMNMSLIFIIISAILSTVSVLEGKQLNWMGFIWIILGITSSGVLIYHLLKRTAAEKLNVSDICFLSEKQLFGRKRFGLKLTNGKYRDLIEVKKESDITEMKRLFESIGIKTG